MIKELRDKISQFRKVSEAVRSVPQVIDKVVTDNKDILLSLNRDQMLLGRDADGNILSPSYLQDPYFKSQAHAESYARYKYMLEMQHKGLIWNPVYLYPDKDRNTPNLIVTGSFQDRMYITSGTGSFTIGSTYKDSNLIERKYNNRVFGLAPKSKEFFYLEYIKPAILMALNVR